MTGTQIGILTAALLIASIAVYVFIAVKKTPFSDNLLREGNKKVKGGKYSAAKEKYLRAIKLNKFKKGSVIAARNNVILCEFKLKNYQAAIDRAKEVLDISADNPVTLLLLGKTYYETGEYQKAIDTWKTKIAVEEEGDTYSNIALAYAKLGKGKEAAQAVNAAQKNKFADIKALRKEVRKALAEFAVENDQDGQDDEGRYDDVGAEEGESERES